MDTNPGILGRPISHDEWNKRLNTGKGEEIAALLVSFYTNMPDSKDPPPGIHQKVKECLEKVYIHKIGYINTIETRKIKMALESIPTFWAWKTTISIEEFISVHDIINAHLTEKFPDKNFSELDNAIRSALSESKLPQLLHKIILGQYLIFKHRWSFDIEQGFQMDQYFLPLLTIAIRLIIIGADEEKEIVKSFINIALEGNFILGVIPQNDAQRHIAITLAA